MPGKYGPAGKWVHDRAHRIMREGDTSDQYGKKKGKSVAYAIAVQQAHKLGKSPKGFRTSTGVHVAKKKFDLPKKEYRKTAAKFKLPDIPPSPEDKAIESWTAARDKAIGPFPKSLRKEIGARLRALTYGPGVTKVYKGNDFTPEQRAWHSKAKAWEKKNPHPTGPWHLSSEKTAGVAFQYVPRKHPDLSERDWESVLRRVPEVAEEQATRKATGTGATLGATLGGMFGAGMASVPLKRGLRKLPIAAPLFLVPTAMGGLLGAGVGRLAGIGPGRRARRQAEEEVADVRAREKMAMLFPFVGNIEKITEDNRNFREVLQTGKNAQLVVMNLKVGERLDPEVHPKVDQFFRVEEGKATLVLEGKQHNLNAGGAWVIPAGMKHEIINASKTEPLKVYTIYSPPHHPPGTVDKTKEDAARREKATGLTPASLAKVGGFLKIADEDESGTPGKKVPQEVLLDFFRKNPSPSDDQVHDLAEAHGASPHTMETQIYSILGKALREKRAGVSKLIKPIASTSRNQLKRLIRTENLQQLRKIRGTPDPFMHQAIQRPVSGVIEKASAANFNLAAFFDELDSLEKEAGLLRKTLLGLTLASALGGGAKMMPRAMAARAGKAAITQTAKKAPGAGLTVGARAMRRSPELRRLMTPGS